MSDPGSRKVWQGALPRILLSLLIGAGFVWLLARGGLPLVPSRQALRDVSGWTLVEFMGLVILANMLRTYRWVYLIRPLAPEASKVRVTGISMVGFSAVFFLPLRSGELIRPYMIARDGRVSFMQAAGTVGAERVIDGLVLTLFTFVALSVAKAVSPLPRSLGDLPLPVAAVPAAVYSALVLFAAAFAVMTAFYVARKPARRLTEAVVGLVSKRAATWAATTLERIADGLSFLPSTANLIPFMAATLGCWATTILSQWLLLRALGLDATLAQATTTVGVQGLGTLVPAGPGMFGAYQIAGFSALAMYFPMAQVKLAGAVFIFVTYTSALVFCAMQLVAGFLLLRRFPATPVPKSS